MNKAPEKRTLYSIWWYDIEGDAGWGEGAEQPPVVCEPAFILSWPRKNQKVPCYRIAHAYCEETPGGSQVIPAACVPVKPTPICEMEMRYR